MPRFKKWFSRNKVSKTHPRRAGYQDPNSPPYLPARRPRTLTLPLLNDNESHSPASKTALTQWTSSQPKSAFMNLPAEIRLEVYEALFGGRKIHIAFEFASRERGGRDFKEWRWWHCVCSWDQVDQRWWRDRCSAGYDCGNEPGPSDGRTGKVKVDFALLLTCRRIYSEGIDMLYSTTTFQFRTHELLRSLPQLILPQRFARLTSVELTWDLLPAQDPVYSARGQESYEALWGLLATMPELRALRIALRALPCPDPPPDGLRLAWLGPLEQLLRARRLETCELMVPRSYARHLRGGDGEELGFELGELDDIIAEVSCFAMGV